MNKPLFIFLVVLPVPVLLGSLFLGPPGSLSSEDIAFWMFGWLRGHAATPATNMARTVVLDVRFPRVVLSFLVGATLSCSGAALQAMFRNPLVSSSILGLQAGAAFGAALALGTAWLPLYPCAFGFGLLAVGCSYALARDGGRVAAVHLILSGIVVSGIFTAFLIIVQFFADPFRLQTIVHWTMGNLHTATWSKLSGSWWLMVGGMAILWLWRWKMNVLALGEDEARSVGMNPEREKLVVLLAASLATSASVAVAGIIGMVCLVVPHMTRMLVGADNRVCIPVCATFGGAFLVLVDNVSRCATSFEIPIGVFTTLIGGPFFIFLLKRTRLGWSD